MNLISLEFNLYDRRSDALTISRDTIILIIDILYALGYYKDGNYKYDGFSMLQIENKRRKNTLFLLRQDTVSLAIRNSQLRVLLSLFYIPENAIAF